ncbi:hypothetical protein M404DRAFT_1004300, partial [Pisolithus tinctorius Marx 270]
MSTSSTVPDPIRESAYGRHEVRAYCGCTNKPTFLICLDLPRKQSLDLANNTGHCPT